MTWLKLDDHFAGHSKISPLSDGAFRLHVSGLLFCASHETDGRIPLEQVPILMPRYRRSYLDEVAVRGLWILHAELVEIHDFNEFNPTRAEIKERQRLTRERVQRWRERQSNREA